MTQTKTRIPNCVMEYMGGAEIYPASQTYEKITPEEQARAIEDARYLIDVCGDGYHGNPTRIAKACRTFLQRVSA